MKVISIPLQNLKTVLQKMKNRDKVEAFTLIMDASKYLLATTLEIQSRMVQTGKIQREFLTQQMQNIIKGFENNNTLNGYAPQYHGTYLKQKNHNIYENTDNSTHLNVEANKNKLGIPNAIFPLPKTNRLVL